MAATTAADLKSAIATLAATSNVELWNLARNANPTFRSHTAEATAETFTEKGFEALKRTDIKAINEFVELTMMVGAQIISAARAKNLFDGTGLIEHYFMATGAYMQRVAINSIKPTSPKFLGLKNGDSIDPFVVRKAESSERFFGLNFDYQSFITIQDYQIKTIMTNEFGMGSYIAGVMQALANGYTLQEYTNTLEAINTAINSTEAPLKDSQVITLSVADKANLTNDELTSWILSVQDLGSAMETSVATGAYNSAGFVSTVNKSDMVLLIRPSLMNRIKVNLMTGAFNPENLSLGFSDILQLQNFGGLQPYKEAGFTTPLYEVYDKNGAVIGYNESEGQDTVTVEEEAVFWKDPNEDVVAILMQKGAIFEIEQNPYEVQPIYNPAGLYTNYWASRPNTGINYDSYYNVVVFKITQ